MRAPTTSWWWKLTPPGPTERVFGLPMSCRSAARRTRSSGRVLRDDRDRVREHVLVLMDRVLLELHGVELGEELVGQAGAAEEPQPGRRVGQHEQLRELVADALRAHDLEPTVQLLDRGHELGVGLEQ